jgi:DNA-binding XRE family transcriptional regulator
MNNTNTDKTTDNTTDQYMCFEDYAGQQMRNPELRRRYEVLDEEFQLIEELIKLRIENNLTQAELAEKTGIKQAAIARLESGRTNPTFMTLARIADALDKKLAFV